MASMVTMDLIQTIGGLSHTLDLGFGSGQWLHVLEMGKVTISPMAYKDHFSVNLGVLFLSATGRNDLLNWTIQAPDGPR